MYVQVRANALMESSGDNGVISDLPRLQNTVGTVYKCFSNTEVHMHFFSQIS